MNLQEAIQEIKTGTGSLDLELNYQKIGDSEVVQLGKVIAISKLTSLYLNLSSNQIKNVDELGKAFAVNTKLTSLELWLNDNQIKNVDELGKGLAVNTKLTSLYLNLSSNQIKNVDELGKALAVNTKLTLLYLYLNNNQIKNVDELGKGLAVNTKLTSLYLNLSSNQIKNVDELGKALAVNTKLTLLYLYLNNNQIKNVDELGKGLAVNTKLTSLELWLNDNQIKYEGAKAIAGGIKDTKLHSLNIDLWHNQIKDEGAEILSDAIKKSSAKIELYYYYYDNNDINEESKITLSEALALNADPEHRAKQKTVKTKIEDINFDTEESKLDSIKKLATQFDLIKEFDNKYNRIQDQINESINKININTSLTTIFDLDKQAKVYNLGENAATAKYNKMKREEFQEFERNQQSLLTKVTKLENQQKEYKKEIDQLEEDKKILKQSKEQLSNNTKQLDELNADNQEKSNQLEQLQNRTLNLQQANQNLTQALKIYKKDLVALDEKIQKQKEKYEITIKALEETQKLLNGEQQKLIETINELQEKNLQQDNTSKKLEKQNNELKQDIDDLKKENNQQQLQITSFEEEQDKCEEKQQALEQTINKLATTQDNEQTQQQKYQIKLYEQIIKGKIKEDVKKQTLARQEAIDKTKALHSADDNKLNLWKIDQNIFKKMVQSMNEEEFCKVEGDDIQKINLCEIPIGYKVDIPGINEKEFYDICFDDFKNNVKNGCRYPAKKFICDGELVGSTTTSYSFFDEHGDCPKLIFNEGLGTCY